jgi:CheY-like chemotaxis protein
MQQALEDAGIRIVRTARDGTEALALHAAEPFDIILLNYIMPVMTGIEVLGILRARDDNVPIIMHSGCTRAAVERLCRGLSISRFVQSPFTEPEYLESVRAVLTEEPRTSPSAGETSNDRTRQSSSEGRRK